MYLHIYKEVAIKTIVSKIIEDGVDIPYIDMDKYVFDNYVDGKEDAIVSAFVDEIRADVIWWFEKAANRDYPKVGD